MKRQVRLGVFETNSSSTHSLTMCNEEDYKMWGNGGILFDEYLETFEETYTTPNGEKVVAFGKFGYDN